MPETDLSQRAKAHRTLLRALKQMSADAQAQADRKTARSQAATRTAQLKITLRHLDPAIWRRVLVPHDITLPRLHDVIQTVMPWTNSHMHNFTTKTATYETFFDDDDELGFGQDFPGALERLDETKHRLCDLLPKPKTKCVYTYDFGDNWEHDIVLEKLLPADKRLARAEVLAGENACPPDDCGSIDGYSDLVEIMLDPKHPEHAERHEWLGLKKGEKFDPYRCDLAAINAELRRLKI